MFGIEQILCNLSPFNLCQAGIWKFHSGTSSTIATPQPKIIVGKLERFQRTVSCALYYHGFQAVTVYFLLGRGISIQTR
jgi:hypothetical protein